ncbi:MAG: hypothetical protein V2B15_07125 [Bacteroidota bacterium]
MKKSILLLSLLLVIMAISESCSVVPLTGRKQFTAIPIPPTALPT